MSNIGTSNTRNATLASGQTVANSGILLKLTSGTLTAITAVGDTPFGVSLDESSRDADQALVAGGTVTYCPSGGVVWMRAAAGTYNLGATVYLAANGYCDDTQASGATALGTYVGAHGAVVTAGLLVPVNTNSSTW